MTEQQNLINLILKQIEDKLDWGDRKHWQAKDFDNLSELIFNETKIVLSPSTLKRVWGKVNYTSKPNLSTLDTLAKFVGYPDWRAFARSNPQEIQTIVIERSTGGKKKRIIFIVILLLAGLALVMFFLKSKSKKLFYTDIFFSSKAIASGLPNTVLFQYDVRFSNADSVFIQQSWDATRRVKVSKDSHEYASIYYMPGYYRAKLILNGVVVKEHDVFIESDGWMGVLENEPIPTYLPKDMLHHGNKIGISPVDLKLDISDLTLDVPNLVLSNVAKKLLVAGDNFNFEVDIQNTLNHANSACKETSVMLLGTDGVIRIPLAKPGCAAQLKLRIGDQLLAGDSNDLSRFGVDFSNPVHLKCVVHGERIKIEFNHKTVYDGPFKKGIGNIVGTRISFRGSGYINNFILKKYMDQPNSSLN